jgi:hypothetical protein
MHAAAETERLEGGGDCTPSARVVALGEDRYAVHIHGVLAPGWAGSLARELAARRVSIVRGWARRGHAPRWEAQFTLQVLERDVNPFHIDFLALARCSVAPRRLDKRPRLDAYRIERTSHDVEVTVRAADTVGLLDALLATFAFYSLFPHEMTIDTRGGVAHDLIRLQRIGGGLPSEVVVAALEATLRELAGE